MHALKESLCSADFWLRLLYTILFMLAWQVVEILLALLVVIQIMSRRCKGMGRRFLALRLPDWPLYYPGL